MRRDEAFWGTAVVVVSAAVNVAHGLTRGTASHVPTGVAARLHNIRHIYAAPVVAAVLLWTRCRLAGVWVLVASMAGSLVFGLHYHFLIPGPDNVFMQPSGTWQDTFQVTAVLPASRRTLDGED